MESYQNDLIKDYMYPIVTGIMSRIRTSHMQGLISGDSYQSYMREACYLRDNFLELTEKDITDKLKQITPDCGTWRLYDALALHFGINHTDQIQRDYTELSFYDSQFSPIFYVINEKGRSDMILDNPTSDQLMILNNQNTAYQLQGCCQIFESTNNTILMFGNYVNETTEFYIDNYTHLYEKRNAVLELCKKKVDVSFSKEYITNMSIRNFDSKPPEAIFESIKGGFEDLKKWVKGRDTDLLTEFQDGNAERKREILTLMALRKCYLDLIPTMRSLCSKAEFESIYTSLHLNIQEELQQYLTFQNVSEIFEHLINAVTNRKRKRKPAGGAGADGDKEELTLRQQVEGSKASKDAMDKALQQVETIENNRDGSSAAKAEKYVKGFLKLPFSIVKDNSIQGKRKKLINRAHALSRKMKLSIGKDKLKDSKIMEVAKHACQTSQTKRQGNSLIKAMQKLSADKRNLLSTVRPKLDEAIYGHDHAKKQFEQIVAQWTNGNMNGAVIGIQGPPGNGKTSMVKEGLSRCLQDADGSNRPFVFVPLGGLRDGAGLVGHGFTYIGSTWGKIADGLMKAKCMNPIFYFDELDKVSLTQQGQEIIGILTHLTDSTQNSEFHDEYFQGIPLDLSKALFVFTFNDAHKIDPILRDRIQIIKTKALKIPEKLVIGRDYMLPKILDEIGIIPDDIQIPDELYLKVIEDYTAEAGVRKMKEILYDLVRESNRRGISGIWNTPYQLDMVKLKDILKRRHSIIHDKVHDKPQIGVMNGMYANSTGLGGITRIETTKCFSKNHLELKLTGNQGDIMKESMQCALSVAWNKLTPKQKEKVNKDCYGIHIHCPSGATPKDGPSAGGAITLTILSLLKQKLIPNDIAMTGEIDLRGNITEIGGLDEKLLGAKKAGVKRVFIPMDNERHWKQILEDEIIVLDDDTDFEVIPVRHIDEVLKVI